MEWVLDGVQFGEYDIPKLLQMSFVQVVRYSEWDKLFM